ncbi:putative Glutaredoxin [Quillaja saponaria]|uniref:Glutaredoxin n=1 Tax=Quillaja saponaria TaxID=32244 RepID=A0AAD7QHH7_QUISA|nr:putative Glutaredoxin [Quillaja saponaria]
MQAIPYKSWRPFYTTTTTHFTQPLPITQNSTNSPSVSPKSLIAKGTENMMLDMVSENPVIVFARRDCCMNHVVKRLLLGLGVNPAVYEVDEKDEVGVVNELERIGENDENHGKVQFPALFIGGRLFGGLDRLMAAHISGELGSYIERSWSFMALIKLILFPGYVFLQFNFSMDSAFLSSNLYL